MLIVPPNSSYVKTEESLLQTYIQYVMYTVSKLLGILSYRFLGKIYRWNVILSINLRAAVEMSKKQYLISQLEYNIRITGFEVADN